ncbi:WecB/TagA/CpsF family glycosyltransferase [Desnuesiella massiliensis]|uniref:WecB/TagA/CpsF family glycosyltransferase n=1 Tax=Desnuesiella massiliensis TaxID=1650662 RepID=UPI0006E2EDD4|nr:WecB/TagA/CpsF family glycosyltransferase [Desnuesiella massiliensis]
MSISILDFNIFSDTKGLLINEIFRRSGKTHIISGNPEVLFNGYYNEDLNADFKAEESIIIPDGVGVILVSKLLRTPVKEKIAGIEVMQEIIKTCSEEGKSIFLLGAKKNIVEKCIENLEEHYPTLSIAGFNDGYFDINNCDELIEKINSSEAQVLFVAMGCPRQEKFIINYMDRLKCKVFMGVGGSFDVIAGSVNRAPKWMITLGLEWLYRVSKEPWRIKRLNVIPKFILLALKHNKRQR